MLRLRQVRRARRLAARTFAASEEQFLQLAQSVTDVFWIYEPQSHRFLYASAAYETEWRQDVAALYADHRQWLRLVHADDQPPLQLALDHLQDSDSDGYTIEYRMITDGGQERWIQERTFPVAYQAGRTRRMAGVSQDITQRKAAELELRRTHRCKDEFIATLAHELRAPLQPIRSAVDLLVRAQDDALVLRQRAVSVIERQVDHLTRLVDDLLDVQRIAHGKISLRSQSVLLADVIAAAVETHRTLAQSKRLLVTTHLPKDDVWVFGDPVRLTQVFSNLLHNASKFSHDGGTIEVAVRRLAGQQQVAVSVRDEGAGIAANVIGSIFEIFTQAQELNHARHGGLGIGLSVVRSLTELHGGTVCAHSNGAGTGSEFVVTLPLVVCRATSREPSHA